MADTFDTSRVGGGTYELEQDSNGNYKLKSVGFNQVNKLNLPDVKDLNLPKTTTTKDSTTTTTADPFKKLGTQNTGGAQNTGGGQDYSAVAPREAKVKEATVKDFSDRQRLDPRDNRSAQEIQNLQNAQATYRSTAPNLTSAPGYATSFSGTGQDLVDRKAANEAIMSAKEKYATETQYNPSKTTGLQKVTSAISNTVENIMNNSATVAVAKGVGSVLKGISNAITSPEQQINNSANMTALRSNGYITNQQGKVIGKDGQAVSAADSVFGGMNSVSGFGDISDGAASRIGTRNNIGQARVDAKYGKDSKESKDFAAKTKEFEKDLQSHNNTKNSAIEAAKSEPAANPNLKAGADNGGNNNSRVICTYFYSKNQFNLIDLQLDTEFSRNNLSDEVKIGYWFWAIPLVDWMKKHENSNNWWVKLVKNSTKLFAQERAKEIAYTMGKKNKGSLIGKFVRLFGETGCYILGLIIKPFVFNKYKGFLNEYQKDVNLIGKI